MRPTSSRPSYRRVLATVLGLLSRRQPLALAAFVCSGLLLMGANVLVFHLLEGFMSQLGAGDRVGQLAGAIVVVGAAILLRELLEMVADPLSVYFGGKGMSALTEALNDKAARLEIIAFERLDAHEGLELAKQGADAAVTMLLFFLFPVYQVTFFVVAAAYLFSLSPLLALVIPLMFAPRLASYFIQGSRFYRFERRTVPVRREFQYLERCLLDREYFKETRVLGAGAELLRRYRATIARFNAQRWREDLRLGGIDLALNILVLLGYGGSFLLAALLLSDGQHRRRRLHRGDLRDGPVADDDAGGDQHAGNLLPRRCHRRALDRVPATRRRAAAGWRLGRPVRREVWRRDGGGGSYVDSRHAERARGSLHLPGQRAGGVERDRPGGRGRHDAGSRGRQRRGQDHPRQAAAGAVRAQYRARRAPRHRHAGGDQERNPHRHLGGVPELPAVSDEPARQRDPGRCRGRRRTMRSGCCGRCAKGAYPKNCGRVPTAWT